MSEYRLVLTKKPALNLWLVEGKKRKTLSKTNGRKAELLREEILPILQLDKYMSWRDGRVNYRIGEESAIRLQLAMKMIAGVRDWTRVNRYVQSVKNMDRGETLSWYSLQLKLGFKAILAMRTAYYG